MKIQTFSVILLFSLLAQSQVTFQQIKGKPFTITVDTDKVIEVKTGSKTIATKTPFEISENGCNNKIGAKGVFSFTAGMKVFSAVWIKHPDKTKINTLAKYKEKGYPPNELTSQHFLNSLSRFTTPISSKSIAKEEFSCANYEWLDSEKVPEILKISQWNVEFMLPNSETGVMENTTLQGALGLELIKNSKQNFEFSKLKRFSNTLFFGDIWALTLKNKKGELCQVALKPNLNDVSDALQILFSNTLKAQDTYLWEEDEFSLFTSPEYSHPYFFGKFFLDRLEKGTYELE